MPKEPTIILDRVKPGDQRGMKSAIGEQRAVKLWEYTQDQGGTYWFWPADHPEQGSMVHCGDHVMAGKRSEGYGGRVVEFKTRDGVIPIQGPWHSNSNALFGYTGVDLRDRHLTWGVVSLNRERQKGGYTAEYVNVLHVDPPEGVLGKFDRIKEIAQKFADELGTVVYCYARSHGGTSEGHQPPSAWTKERVHEFFYPPEGVTDET